jgi:hypothetical protein
MINEYGASEEWQGEWDESPETTASNKPTVLAAERRVQNTGGMIITAGNQSAWRKTCYSATIHHKSHMYYGGIEPEPLQ